MKNLMFFLFFFLFFTNFASAQEVKLSDTFGECITFGGRIATKVDNCRHNNPTIAVPYTINDSMCFAVKIAVVPKNKPNSWNGFSKGSLFLEPNNKLSYLYPNGRIEACDLDTMYYIVILPWSTSLPETLITQTEYKKNKGCYSEIFMATRASFEVAVKMIAAKKE